jgi:glutamate-1-semialdehyde 2,1-aminomutase
MNIHAVPGPVHKPADLDDADATLKELLFHALVDRGIYLARRGYMALSAAITDDDCDRMVDALTDALDEIA